MKGPRGRPATAALVLALLATPLLVAPSGGADDAVAPAEPLAALAGAQAALRLYGCVDALDATDLPEVASRFRVDRPAPGAPDGRLDCTGDRLHLENALLQGAADPFFRTALGPRDQTVAASMRYLPTAWFPGPGQPDGVADLVDPSAGFFDRDGDAVLDYAPPTDARFTSAGAPEPTDRAPARDGLFDFAARGDGANGADLYFPAVEVAYRHVWTAGGNLPVALPEGGSFLFPLSGAGSTPGLDSWSTAGRSVATHWHPTPFGFGDGEDHIGAFHTVPLTLKVGEEAWFLDHGIRITGFFGTAGSPRVSVEVLYDGPEGPEVLATSVILTPTPDEPGQYATLDRRAGSPANIVFSDRTGIDRNVPPFGDPEDPAQDAAWFSLVETVDVDESGPADQVTLRLGRVVSDAAPWNAWVVDQVLYRIAALDESGGALGALDLRALHPLDVPVEVAAAALRLRGLSNTVGVPLLPPFERPHVALDDLVPGVDRDDHGFLQASGTRAAVASDDLALQADARVPAERARPVDPLVVQWRTAGHEDRFGVPMVGLADDRRLTYSMLVPARYLEVVLPDGRYRVDSVLFDDGATLTAATDEAASPRGLRSFVFDPQDPTPFVLGPQGLHLFSATAAHPEAGDRVAFDPAVLHWDDFAGRIQTPDRLADQAMRLSVAHRAYAPLGDAGGLRPLLSEDGSLRDGSQGVFDNLWDVSAANLSQGMAATLEARYDLAFLDRTTLEAFAPPLGARTALMVPAADRDPATPGLDSFDMDGDGSADEVYLRGYWDMGRSGTAWERLVTGGTYSGAGNASTVDLLWLQSRPFTIATGVTVQFLDHGVRFDGSGSRDGAIVPTLTLLDHRAPGAPRVIGSVADADAEERECIAVAWDGRLVGGALSCGALAVSPAERATPSDDGHAKWWVQVQAASEGAVTLVLNRVVTDVDRAAAGDEGRIHVGGGVYRWEAPDMDADRVRGIALTQLVPLRTDVAVPVGGDRAVAVMGLPEGGTLPVFPPLAGPHRALQLQDVAVERNEAGFLDGRGDPSDPDALLASRALRLDEREPIVVRYEASGREERHPFVFLDPTRAWDPERQGTAFVNGIFAAPSAGAPGGRHVPPLQGAGRAAFDEALRSSDDRGWDHYARIQVEGPDRVVVDSARLAPPKLTARIPDQAPTATEGPHPNGPASMPAQTRGAGPWVWGLHDPRDLYVVPLDGAPPLSPTPSPTTIRGTSPTPSVPWPTQAVTPTGASEEGPVVPALLVVGVLVGYVAWRRR